MRILKVGIKIYCFVLLFFLFTALLHPAFVHAQTGIPQSILNGLRKGGTDLVFGWYDSNNPSLTEFNDDLPVIAAKGGGHVRLSISMGTLENGTTGKVRDDRYQSLISFINLAWSNRLITIVDLHNTGMSEPGSTDWTDNYMWGIGNTTIEQRHTSLLVDLATRLNRDVPRDRFLIGPGNEPQYSPRWYTYQASLIPKIRAACPECVISALADDWQSIAATINYLHPTSSSWWDSRVIADVHMYAPLGLTHCAYPGTTNKCPGKTWPGTYTDYLPAEGVQFSGTWNKTVLEGQFNQLWAWQNNNNNVFIWLSEIGTANALADDVKSAYLGDVISILKAHGAGWTCYEWDKNFGMYPNHPKTIAACFNGPSGSPGASSLPSSSPIAVVTPTPVPSSAPGAIITGLTVQDTTNASAWSVQSNAQVGNTVYGDRTFTFASLPASVTGKTWIRTANASKNYTGDPVATLNVTQAATVYISLDTRHGAPPAWLSSWTQTGENLTINGNSGIETFNLYSKSFAANSTVTLGSLNNTNVSFYTVFVSTSGIACCSPGDLNLDGRISIVDVLTLVSRYLRLPVSPAAGAAGTADLNGDGKVNAFDFAKVVAGLLGSSASPTP